MMFQASAPKTFWVEAFSTATFLINRLPTPQLQMDGPYRNLFNKDPVYSSLLVFGTRCFPYLCHYAKDKLQQRSLPCIFLGYSDKHKGYRCLHNPTGRVYISRHVVFQESLFPFDKSINNSDLDQVKGELATLKDWMNPIDVNAPLENSMTTICSAQQSDVQAPPNSTPSEVGILLQEPIFDSSPCFQKDNHSHPKP